MLKKINNNIFEKLFKFIIIIVSFIGIYLNIRITKKISMFLYFTIISNFFVFIFYLISYILFILKRLKKNNIYYIIKGMITVNITLTMAVYNFALNGGELYILHPIAGLFVHVVTPGMVILDYIIFSEKGNLKKVYPIYWASSLFIYTIICMIYSLIGGIFPDGNKYPYFFMDVDQNGIFGVLCFDLILLYNIYII